MVVVVVVVVVVVLVVVVVPIIIIIIIIIIIYWIHILYLFLGTKDGLTLTYSSRSPFYINYLYYSYTGCHRRNGPNFGRVFLMLNYTDITQNTYVPS